MTREDDSGGGTTDGTPGSGTSEAADRLTGAVRLVGHETRAGVLLALAERQRERPRESSLGFADLRRAVGHDDPGNFNYHLQQLTGTLVTRTDDGYRLSNVGQRFVGALRSGRYSVTDTPDVGDHEADCPVCGVAATVAHRDGSVRVDCPAGHSLVTSVGPELLAERGPDETLRVAMHRARYEIESIRQGVCPLCDGPTSATLAHHAERAPSVVFRATCERCGLHLQTTAEGLVLDHPAVVSLCHAHGIDLREDAWAVLTAHVEEPRVLEENPLRVSVGVTVGGETVTLSLDERGQVAMVEGPV
jgi:ribosomal protein S27AE